MFIYRINKKSDLFLNYSRYYRWWKKLFCTIVPYIGNGDDGSADEEEENETAGSSECSDDDDVKNNSMQAKGSNNNTQTSTRGNERVRREIILYKI